MAKTRREQLNRQRRPVALRDVLALLLLVLVCALFFRKAAALRGVFFHYDHAVQNFPYRAFFAGAFRAGRFPLWTSRIFCGFPLFAESQSNVLYPPFPLLFGLLKPWVAYNYYHVLHFGLAAAATYVLARALGIGRAGALLAGLCYMLSGPVLFHAHHTNIVVALAWLPLLLALIELSWRRSRGWLIALAAGTGALVLGAQPQYTLYCALACAIYLGWRAALAHLSDERPLLVRGSLLGALMAAAVGGLLAAVQVLPLAELVGHSSRAAASYAAPVPGVPGNLMTLFLPHYFGSPGLGSYWAHVEPGLYSEVTLFMGVGALTLAAVGGVADRSRRTLFLVGLGLFGFLFALGYHTPVYTTLGRLPLFRASRFPSRFAFLAALSVALLAGTGLEKLCADGRRPHVRKAVFAAGLGVFGLSAVCVIAALAISLPLIGLAPRELGAKLPRLSPFRLALVWRHLHRTLPADIGRLGIVILAGAGLLFVSLKRIVPAKIATLLWCLLVAGELAWAGREFTAVTDPDIYRAPPPLVKKLRELPPGRIFRHRYHDSSAYPRRVGTHPSTPGWALAPNEYARSLDLLPGNANMIWGIPSVGGFSPLQTEALRRFLGRPDDSGTVLRADPSPALRTLGARYILTPQEDLAGPYERVAQVGPMHLLKDPEALPRAWIVHRTERVQNDEAALSRLRDPDFPRRTTALVHEAAAELPAAPNEPTPPDETAHIAEDTGDVVMIRVHLAAPGMLVLADQHYPGWRAEVDGEPAELRRVNYLLRGVRLPAGRHKVRFIYEPASFRLGLLLTVCGLALLAAGAAAWLVWGRARTPPRPKPAPSWAPPYAARSRRLLIVVAVVLLAAGPLLRWGLWRRLPSQLSPLGRGRSEAAQQHQEAHGGMKVVLHQAPGRLKPDQGEEQ